MKIRFPTSFNIQYPEENKKYYNRNNQNIVKQLLTEASNGYCMYCGNKIVINSKNYGQLDHSIEKTQNGTIIQYLNHCKFNLSITCSVCNTSFKKCTKGIRIIGSYSCKDKCTFLCEEYKKTLLLYFKYNRIILMRDKNNCLFFFCFLKILKKHNK